MEQLKIERDLVTQGNFTWYDPIRKATSLVLDGQTLINLEVSGFGICDYLMLIYFRCLQIHVMVVLRERCLLCSTDVSPPSGNECFVNGYPILLWMQ